MVARRDGEGRVTPDRRHPRFGASALLRPLADAVAPVLDPVLARRGFGRTDIVSLWDEIVGERLAAVSQPLEVKWAAPARLGHFEAKRTSSRPPKSVRHEYPEPLSERAPSQGPSARSTGGRSATLVVRVESGFALELQHLADIVIDRVNARFGWRCVSRLTLRQGPIERALERKRNRAAADPAATAAAGALVADIADDSLRLALTRLGAHVMTRDGEARTFGTRNGKP